jgi:hypothetical protein
VDESAKDSLSVKQESQNADSNYFSDTNLKICEEEKLDASISDGNVRKRDPRFAHQKRYKPKKKTCKKTCFGLDDFAYDEATEVIGGPMGSCCISGYTSIVSSTVSIVAMWLRRRIAGSVLFAASVFPRTRPNASTLAFLFWSHRQSRRAAARR